MEWAQKTEWFTTLFNRVALVWEKESVFLYSKYKMRSNLNWILCTTKWWTCKKEDEDQKSYIWFWLIDWLIDSIHSIKSNYYPYFIHKRSILSIFTLCLHFDYKNFQKKTMAWRCIIRIIACFPHPNWQYVFNFSFCILFLFFLL